MEYKMYKYKIRKLILPFFPDSKWLRNRWWHRLSLVISYLWVGFWGLLTIIALYPFISTNIDSYLGVQKNIQLRQDIQNLLNQKNIKFDYDSAYKAGYSYEEILQYINSSPQDQQQLSQKLEQSNQPRDWLRLSGKQNDNGTQFNVDFPPFIIFLLLIAIGVFTPSLIYRIFLYIATNNKWREIKES